MLNTTPPAFNDDRWCIDDRGVLTLDVCMETYRCLGLLGTKVRSAEKKGTERRCALTRLIIWIPGSLLTLCLWKIAIHIQ